MDRVYEKLNTLLSNARKSFNRPYTDETVEAKRKEVNKLESEVQIILSDKDITDEEREEHVRQFVALRGEIIQILTTHQTKTRVESDRLKQHNTTTEVTIMTSLDLNELATISKFIPVFNGKRDDLHSFITNIELVHPTIAVGKRPSFFSFVFNTRLEPKIQNRLKQDSTPTTIETLVTSLKTKYGPTRSANTILNELTKITQRNNNLSGFATKIESLVIELNEVQIAEQGEDNKIAITNINNGIAFNSFINGLTNPQILATIDASQVKTFSEALSIAEKIDSRMKQGQVMYQTTNSNNRNPNNNINPNKNRNSDCSKCGRKHNDNRCPAMGMTCHKCGRENHFANKCFTKNNNDRNKNNRNNNNSNNRNNNNNRSNNNNNRSNNNYRGNNRNVNHVQSQENYEPEPRRPGTPEDYQ